MAKLTKLTGQQEKFAREYVRCGIAAKAYRLAYNTSEDTRPESIWSSASETLAIPKVRQRVDELIEKAAKRAGFTVETALIELDQVRVNSLDDAAWAAANASIMGKARVAGLLKDADEGGSKGISVTVNITGTDVNLL